MELKHFDESEFVCKCGCGRTVKRGLMMRVDAARERSGVRYILTSARRCIAHNKAEKASSTSSHIKGLAVDIKFNSSHEKYRIIVGLIYAGFTRIGINNALGFIHADIDPDKPQEVLFSY